MAGNDALTPAAFVRVHRVLWLALGTAPMLYGIVLALLIDRQAGAPPLATEPLWILFAALAAGIAALSIWWRRRYQAGSPPPAAAPTPWPEVRARLSPACLVAWALSEGVATLGLALGLLMRSSEAYLPFLAVSLFLFYLHRPGVWSGWPAAQA